MTAKPPSVCLDLVQNKDPKLLNECAKRFHLSTIALMYGRKGVRKVSEYFGTNQKTLYKGIHEIKNNDFPPEGRIRRPGGGAKDKLDQHPEWIAAVQEILESHKAGLPQDESVFWTDLQTKDISKLMADRGIEISDYHIRKIMKRLGYKRRSFKKDIPLKSVENRNEQFEEIASVREKCAKLDIPVLSIDTKKKELLGNFQRPGKAICHGVPKSLDHDFSTFGAGTLVPHGIYDVQRNEGYLSLGGSHDTAQFVCDNIARVWDSHLIHRHPEAKTMVLLCDGGGSNSSSHRIFKQCLMDLANDLGMNILVMHYPPYCSKFNPIEHRLFSQITRSWSGAPLLTKENAAERAARTTTSTGLKVNVDINDNTYLTQRPIAMDYDERVKKQIVFLQRLPKWNYLIKPIS